MKLRELLDTDLIMKIMGEGSGTHADVWKAARITPGAYNKWRRKSEEENPRGLYLRMRNQIDEATDIARARALKDLHQMGVKHRTVKRIIKGASEKKEDVQKTVLVTKKDVRAHIEWMDRRFPDMNPRVQAELIAYKHGQDRFVQSMAALPVIPASFLDTKEVPTCCPECGHRFNTTYNPVESDDGQ